MEGMGSHVAETGIRLTKKKAPTGQVHRTRARRGLVASKKRLVSSLCVMHTKGARRVHKTDDLGERLTI